MDAIDVFMLGVCDRGDHHVLCMDDAPAMCSTLSRNDIRTIWSSKHCPVHVNNRQKSRVPFRSKECKLQSPNSKEDRIGVKRAPEAVDRGIDDSSFRSAQWLDRGSSAIGDSVTVDT